MVSRRKLLEVHEHVSDSLFALARVLPTTTTAAAGDEMLAIARLLTEAQARLTRMSRDLTADGQVGD
jgi:hypothetical protein